MQGGELFDPLQNFKKQLERVTHLILDVRTFLLFPFSSGLVVSSFHWSNSGRTAKYPLQQVLNIRFVMNKVYKIINSSELFHCLTILEQIQNADFNYILTQNLNLNPCLYTSTFRHYSIFIVADTLSSP